MPPFPKPAFTYEYRVSSQIEALRDYRQTEPGRDIPAKAERRLLLATWNIANLGVQERRDKDHQLIAEMISWFDLVALQEVNDNLQGLRAIQKHLPLKYRALFSDKAGNNERLAFLYDSSKVALLEKVGEVAIPPSQIRYIRLPITTQKFKGFDRNPYLASFRSRAFEFVLANVHIYFGSDSARDMNRRSLETYALGRWADLRRGSENAYLRDIIALGDFNLPMTRPGDPVYDALTERGLRLPEHSTSATMGSSIRTDKSYDQIAFFPGETGEEFTGHTGVFDFDGPLFETLWDRDQDGFYEYMRYYISDHRVMWAQFYA